METIPLSETFAAACTKALTLTWISCFGVPDTIISDRGLQFTSSLQLQLCEMLNISHKQTTAYHPESNNAIERLHCRLKDALCTRAGTATWPEELPFVLLGLRAQPREDTGLSPVEAVFSAQIVLPNEFLQNDELSVDTIVKNFSKTMHIAAPSLPRHRSSTELPSELLSVPLVWVRRGSLIPPLQPLYDGPYTVLRCGPPSFAIRVGSLDKVVTISRCKACTAADTTPASPHCHGRLPGPCPGGLVSFSDPLVSLPSSSWVPPRDGPRTVFLPGKEVFAHPGPAAPSQPPQKRYPSRQWALLKRLDLWPILLPAEARAGGSLWRAAYAPGDGQTSPAYSSQSVQYLYINHLLSINKLVLSYLLLHLLSQYIIFQMRKMGKM
jgi:hypothetical protein